MKVFVAVLALVAAAAAESAIPAAEPVVATPIVNEEAKIFSVRAAPLSADIELEQEKIDMKNLYYMPFYMVAKNVENNKFEAYLLKDGFRSLYTPEFGFLRNQIMSGNKAGFMLSAVRYLDMPELLLPLEGVKFPQEFNLANMFNMYRKSALAAPIMMVADMDILRSFSLEKLYEIGSFSMFADGVKIFKDYARTAPVANQYQRMLSAAPLRYSVVAPNAEYYPYSVAAAPAAAPAYYPSYYPNYYARTAAFPYGRISQLTRSPAAISEEAEIPVGFNSRRIPQIAPESSPSIVYIA
ncbi:hypothetical protein ONE63_000546 [Megalurothrips usitatus]|uniref:Uncharacterized protein n=1 Tax=Megalurothrips usitatus TaxID=439358 RepID=A0AAV7Y288_9NEOP|nr:hypothetical protein ONE63_000546 [Megalurothrips usitatus]